MALMDLSYFSSWPKGTASAKCPFEMFKLTTFTSPIGALFRPFIFFFLAERNYLCNWSFRDVQDDNLYFTCRSIVPVLVLVRTIWLFPVILLDDCFQASLLDKILNIFSQLDTLLDRVMNILMILATSSRVSSFGRRPNQAGSL